MTEKEKEREIKKLKWSLYFSLATAPIQILWGTFKLLFIPLLWILGLTNTAVDAYKSAERRR